MNPEIEVLGIEEEGKKYAEEMEYVTYVRKIKLIDGILFFNLEEIERFTKE